MKLRIILFIGIVISAIVLTFMATSGNFPPNYGSVGNPTAKDILKNNPEADILKLDGFVYSNVTNREWIQDTKYAKGDKIGEIKKQTSNTTWWYGNLYASKLPKGTKIFTTMGKTYTKGEAPVTVLVEYNNVLFVYQAMVEGWLQMYTTLNYISRVYTAYFLNSFNL
ncbi:hypothetical protein [Salinibacillus xinjiangensis]|uniref:Uncharacterized protein n=1 Tax=Salinibacillus xinjiangensis TaxID=1229268 RepID=A0A6G1X4Y6_9BACI|nr:hypothetical protein [Salinibacillus xinjiangensis]MRG86061.1 hypothetical protein [Salinibacillus xinjiangensis]